MKISDEEIKAALHIYYGKSELPHLFGTMKRALTAALRVRKRLKRERKLENLKSLIKIDDEVDKVGMKSRLKILERDL